MKSLFYFVAALLSLLMIVIPRSDAFRQSFLPYQSCNEKKRRSGVNFSSKFPVRTRVPLLSAIPEEYRELVASAEAKTPAAEARTIRLGLYGAGSLLGLTLAVITSAAMGGNPGAVKVVETLPGGVGILGCVFDAVLFSFFATFVVLELQTAEQNKENIYQEMMKRSGAGRGSGGSGVEGGGGETGRRRKQKQKRKDKANKRNRRLAEMVNPTPVEEGGVDKIEKAATVEAEEVKASPDVKTAGSMNVIDSAIDSVKGFYKQADDMAMSQALLLNKNLEDKGLIKKITDETGFRVVSRNEDDDDGDDDDYDNGNDKPERM